MKQGRKPASMPGWRPVVALVMARWRPCCARCAASLRPMEGAHMETLGAYCDPHQSPRRQSPGLFAVRRVMAVCVVLSAMAWPGPARRRLTVRAGRARGGNLFRAGIAQLFVRKLSYWMAAPRKQSGIPGIALNCLNSGHKLTFQANLFPVFPRKKACSQSVLGTKLLSIDNGLHEFFGFVPNVPKKKGQYPKEGAQRGGLCWCRAMPFWNG